MYLMGLQPEQPIADGAHDRNRLCRRRRDQMIETRTISRTAIDRRPRQGAQIGFTIISLTVSLIAALIPFCS
jgi:hypothetical protein